LRPLPGNVVAERSKQLCSVAKQVSSHELHQWVGWSGDALVEERLRDGVALARNFAYHPIILHGAHHPGLRLRLRIKSVHGFHLEGEVEPAA
jgi:tRNA A37 methylthiotransferase MiaB